MPIIISNELPVKKKLENENIFVMSSRRANTQDIRPLKIAILNLMPEKQKAELDIYRLLSNTPLQLEITLLRSKNHVSKNESNEYLETYYKTFDDIKSEKFDGLMSLAKFKNGAKQMLLQQSIFVGLHKLPYIIIMELIKNN